MSLPMHRTFVLTGIIFALSAVYSLSYARDEFNLRILELDSPLENTQVLADFINNNNLTRVYILPLSCGGKILLIREILHLFFLRIKKSHSSFYKSGSP